MPYANLKNLDEAYLKFFLQDYDLEYTIFCFFNTSGPLQSTDLVDSKVLLQVLTGVALTIYDDGIQTTTLGYFDDNSDTVQKILDYGVGVKAVINIKSDVEISMLDLARSIIEIADSKSCITNYPPLRRAI